VSVVLVGKGKGGIRYKFDRDIQENKDMKGRKEDTGRELLNLRMDPPAEGVKRRETREVFTVAQGKGRGRSEGRRAVMKKKKLDAYHPHNPPKAQGKIRAKKRGGDGAGDV